MPWPFKSAFKVLWHSYIGIVLRNIKNMIKVNKFFIFLTSNFIKFKFLRYKSYMEEAGKILFSKYSITTRV